MTVGYEFEFSNPDVSQDSALQHGVGLRVNTTSKNSDIGFTDENAVDLTHNILHGQNNYGGGTNAKKTFIGFNAVSNSIGSGQHFVANFTQNGYGLSDTFIATETVNFASGPISGDEGVGFRAVSPITQLRSLCLATVTGVTRPQFSTTATQNITASKIAQSISVASVANASVGDWVIIGREAPNQSPNMEAVQITAVGQGEISGIFTCNHPNGVTITPALVLYVDNTWQFGQGRILINLSGASYSTGSVSVISGGGFTGSGTAWTTNMVGGDAINVGAISLDSDTYTGVPFAGTGSNGPLRSWYQIKSVSDQTHLVVHSFSCAGDQSYRGKGTGTYMIRPCAQIMRILDNTLICETGSAAWNQNDVVECAICPFPDVTGFQYALAVFTPGGALRGMFDITNRGARTFETAFNVSSRMETGSNADTDAFGVAYKADQVGIGINVLRASQAAILLHSNLGSGFDDNSSKILWDGGSYIMMNSPNGGLEQKMTCVGNIGFIKTVSDLVIGSGSSPTLSWSGLMGTTPGTFSMLPLPSNSLNGQQRYITDATSGTIGDAPSGGGSHHVVVTCIAGAWKITAA